MFSFQRIQDQTVYVFARHLKKNVKNAFFNLKENVKYVLSNIAYEGAAAVRPGLFSLQRYTWGEAPCGLGGVVE